MSTDKELNDFASRLSLSNLPTDNNKEQETVIEYKLSQEVADFIRSESLVVRNGDQKYYHLHLSFKVIDGNTFEKISEKEFDKALNEI